MGDGEGLATPGTAALEITSRSGRVVVRAEQVDRPVVRSGSAEILADGTVRAHGSARIEIACPPGTDLSIGTSSGRVECHGSLGRVAVTTASGRVDIEEAQDVEVRSSSGRVDVGRCHGACRVATTSGTVDIDAADSIDVTVSSGRLSVGAVGDVAVRGGSGRVELQLARAGTATVRTLSGSVTVAVPEGIAPHLELETRSGRTSSEVPAGPDGTLTVETSSGRIRIVRS
jgi:DUF4097 and DUF4098 domain-containing protein YvlB